MEMIETDVINDGIVEVTQSLFFQHQDLIVTTRRTDPRKKNSVPEEVHLSA